MTDQGVDPDLLHGTLDVLVLKALSFGTRHGYAVARWIHDTTDEAIAIEDRALYVSLHRLEARRLVESSWGLSENNRKARYYRLTAAGQRHLRDRTAAFTHYTAAVFKVLRASQGAVS